MDTTLKQRLIGAAVLVALAVIFLPMLVQGPAPGSGVSDVSTHVPAAPAGEYETRELPLVGAAANQDTGPAALPAAPADGAATPASAESAPATAAATAAPATTAAHPDPAVAAGKWAVSFGAYASERDAQAVLSRLRQAGLDGFSEAVTLNGRPAWRVRVGPYADRALAEAGRLQAVRIRSDVNAQVIALDAHAEAETPAAAAANGAASQTIAAPAAAAVRSEALPPEPAATRPAPATPKAAPVATAPAKPAASPTTTPAAATAPAASKPAPATAVPAASSVGFAVQMGAFSSAAEADALRDRLRAAGYSAIVQPVRTDKGTLNRVRVGPVSTRAEADQLKARLAGSFGAGMVVPHP